MTRIPGETVKAALTHLNRADPVMRELIARVGPFGLKLEKNRFRSLVRAIVAQQISVKAARSIYRRIEDLVDPFPLEAERIAALDLATLRTAGLSGQKASYILDLAHRTSSKELRLRSLARLPDEEVIEQLVQVKGIGVWTAQMFLIFSLGRLDVFAHNDLGIRVALRNLYGLPDLPDKQTSHEIAARWRPYASVASWYCWRSFELPG